MKNSLEMGFHESVVPQVLNGKTSTWRLRDHKFKKGDVVGFKNSQNGKTFGFGKITESIATTVGELNLKEEEHYKTYKNRQELVKAFKRHYPNYEINNNTPAFIYKYRFKKKS